MVFPALAGWSRRVGMRSRGDLSHPRLSTCSPAERQSITMTTRTSNASMSLSTSSTSSMPSAGKETAMSGNGAGQIVQKLWNYCNTLRDDGLSYGDYVQQLTNLLFLKMAHERTQPPYDRPSAVPEGTT